MLFTTAECHQIRKSALTGMPLAVIAKRYVNANRDLTTTFDAIHKVIGYQPHIPTWTDQDQLTLSDERIVKIAYRHHYPRIVLLDNVLSLQECDQVIARSRIHLKPSVIVDEVTGKQVPVKERRSETYYLRRGEDAFIQRLDARCSEIMGKPVEHGESLQVVRYKQGGEYRPHWDYLPGENEPDTIRGQNLIRNGGNRMSTLLIYLNDVPKGGSTYFPGLNVSIKPRKGSAVYFVFADGQGGLDPQTLHAGAPVLDGEKWIMTKWMRYRNYTPY